MRLIERDYIHMAVLAPASALNQSLPCPLFAVVLSLLISIYSIIILLPVFFKNNSLAAAMIFFYRKKPAAAGNQFFFLFFHLLPSERDYTQRDLHRLFLPAFRMPGNDFRRSKAICAAYLCHGIGFNALIKIYHIVIVYQAALRFPSARTLDKFFRFAAPQ